MVPNNSGRAPPRVGSVDLPEAGTANAVLHFRNVSVWGPDAVAMVRAPPDPRTTILALAETHVAEKGLNDLLSYFDRHSWRSIATPTRPCRHIKSAGGVAMGIRPHLRATSVRHLAKDATQTIGLAQLPSIAFQPGPVDFWDFTAASVRTTAGTPLLQESSTPRPG